MSIQRACLSQTAATFLLIPLAGVAASCGGASSSPAPTGGTASELTGRTAAELNASAENHRGEFNGRGNYLIADQFNNRVIEVDEDGRSLWQFGKGPTDFSAASVIGCNDAQRVGELTLMAGTGTPGGQPEAPDCTNPAGCPDNRVLLVDRRGDVKWQYGQFQVSGSGPDQLNTPVQSTWLPNEHVLITDQANERVIEVDMKKDIVWQYGVNGGCTPMTDLANDCLNNPNSAELLENDHILISDENNNRAIEVDRHKHIVATFTAGGTVSGAAFSSRLHDGHTLLTDANNNRVVEVNSNDQVVWEYATNTDPYSNPRDGTGPLPTRAVRLANGDTLISDQYNHRVIEVTHAKQIVRTFGKINAAGYNRTTLVGGGLNSPYDAKRIGDYTGLAPPFGHDFD